MKKIYLIQDVKTKEYFFQHSVYEGFTLDISEAKHFEKKTDLKNEIKLQNSWSTDIFKGRYLEIKKIIKNNG